MSTLKPILLLLVLAVGVCPVNCLREAARHAALAVMAATGDATDDMSQGDPLPGLPCNESGCICRGALLDRAEVVLTGPELPAQPLDVASQPAVAYGGPQFFSAVSSPHELWGPRSTGRLLRTLLASLVI